MIYNLYCSANLVYICNIAEIVLRYVYSAYVNMCKFCEACKVLKTKPKTPIKPNAIHNQNKTYKTVLQK